MTTTDDQPRWWRHARRRAGSKSILSRSVRHAVTLLVLALVIEYLVLPQLAGADKALHLLSQVNLGYAAAGVLLEVAAWLAYAQLTRAVLPHAAPSRFTILRINMTTLAVSHVLPAGTAGGTPVGLTLMTENGVSGADATFAVATQGIGSAVVLNVLLWIALVISIPLRGFNPLYGIAALVGVFLGAAVAALVMLFTRGEDRAADIVRRLASRLPFLDEDVVTAGFRRLATRLRELARDRSLLARAVAGAAAFWLLDAASLWVFLAAFGHLMSPYGLLVAYGLANVLAFLPITPGGLGIVEGVLVPTLVGFGSPRGVAIIGVITYRLVNFWLPIPVGALSYLSLRVEPGASRRRRAEELEELAEKAGRDVEDRRHWAVRHGLRSPHSRPTAGVTGEHSDGSGDDEPDEGDSPPG
ncbi:MAG TPA: lysylphosphatidylglycerol synthase transmembrane domain-containing protein [Acidimicrobiales bacterium]|nr:lysylphosphatidylglycerol synthase transmembrane domain-containing protein [Acidimicrobiales bacterium]